jgi:hypothetical protein
MMNERKSEPNGQASAGSQPCEVTAKKPYVPPHLIKRGSIAELTQGGGSIIDDGLGTLEGHV